MTDDEQAAAQARHLSRLERMEIPEECGCKLVWRKIRLCSCAVGPRHCTTCPMVEVLVSPPCEHVIEADHDVDLETWANWLLDAWSDDYATPPLPPRSHLVQSRAARIAVYRGRVAQGYRLWHPLDLRNHGGDGAELKTGPMSSDGARGGDESITTSERESA